MAKMEQVDIALSFLGDDIDHIVLQCKGNNTCKEVAHYLRERYPSCRPTFNTLFIPDGKVTIINILEASASHGYECYMQFYIERDGEDFKEGDDIIQDKVLGTDQIISHTGAVIKVGPSKIPMAMDVDIAIPKYNSIEVVQKCSTDNQTLVIQYDDPHDLGIIEGIVHKYKRSQAVAMVGRFCKVDVFVNLNDNDNDMRGNRWLRVVYECLKDNNSPGHRYPDALIVHFKRTLNKPTVTLDMLMKGREDDAYYR